MPEKPRSSSSSPRGKGKGISPRVADVLRNKLGVAVGNHGGSASPLRTVMVAAIAASAALAFAFFVGPNLVPSFFEGDAMRELVSCRMQVASLTSDSKADEGKPAARVLASDPNAAKEILKLRKLVKRLKRENKALRSAAPVAAQVHQEPSVTPESEQITRQAIDSAKKMLEECNTVKPATTMEGAHSLASWKGYECAATEADLRRYLDYKPGGICPNDWYFVQRLIFKKNCFSLPRRRCIAVTTAHPSEPLARPDSYFSQAALKDENVRWDFHQCKSFECLNTRTEGDCRNCFNLSLESHRWYSEFRGGIPMEKVLAFKPGSIRIGLDVGGGTGSFAARMATFGATIMTTAFNVETVNGKKAGLPYMETIAQRGVIPLHWPHKARLPFYDGVLDIIHSVNSIKYIPPVEFEELIYEWNRVLRPGGLLWFEMFYAPTDVMPTYVAVIEKLGYKKLYWNYTPKPDKGEREGPHVYLNSVLEKVPTPGIEVLTSPLPEDMDRIV